MFWCVLFQQTRGEGGFFLGKILGPDRIGQQALFVFGRHFLGGGGQGPGRGQFAPFEQVLAAPLHLGGYDHGGDAFAPRTAGPA